METLHWRVPFLQCICLGKCKSCPAALSDILPSKWMHAWRQTICCRLQLHSCTDCAACCQWCTYGHSVMRRADEGDEALAQLEIARLLASWPKPASEWRQEWGWGCLRLWWKCGRRLVGVCNHVQCWCQSVIRCHSAGVTLPFWHISASQGLAGWKLKVPTASQLQRASQNGAYMRTFLIRTCVQTLSK